MGPIGENMLLCPEGLAPRWWRSVEIYGYAIDDVIELGLGNWTYGQPPDVYSTAVLENSKVISIGEVKCWVIIFRDVECRYGQVPSLWITYFSNSNLDGWLSRLLLASGAKCGWCRGCRRLFTHSGTTYPFATKYLENIGRVSGGLTTPDNVSLRISRGYFHIYLYIGKYIDYRSNEIKSYAVIDYPWYALYHRAAEQLTAELSYMFFSLGWESVDLGKYRPMSVLSTK